VQVNEGELFARGPVVVFRWRNAPEWPVEFASANVVQIFGHRSEAFVGGDVAYASVVHPDDLERVGGEVAAAVASEAESFEHEPYRVCHPDGSVRWLHDTTRIVWQDGVATHFIGYVVDISARIEAEERRLQLERQLLHTQKLESLGLLAGGVAHDFNNLLTGMLGEAGLARAALSPEQQALDGHLARIEALALQAAELTQQLLAYSGRGAFVEQPVDLSQLVRDLAGVLKMVLSKKAVVHLDLAADLPTVQADPGQLRQVLMNLLTNASEALGEAVGEIRVSTRVDEVAQPVADGVGGTLPAGRYVVVSIADTGVGMSAEVLAQLFDPFFSTKATGRGLGMSAVQGIVRAHRGRIAVDAEPGHGSRFQLWFPASTEAMIPATPPERSPTWRGEGTVLVVDDEAGIRDVVGMALEAVGFSVRVAGDGVAGLEVHRAHADEIILVVLDQMMPAMSGAECLAELRTTHPTLPVLLISGYDERETLRAHGDDPATRFLQKPFTIAALRGAVRGMLMG